MLIGFCFACIHLRDALQLKRASRSRTKTGFFFMGFSLRFPLFLVLERLQVGLQLRAKLEVVLGGVLE